MFFYNEQDSTIVTDGLTLHLDAGDTASYPGTGTTWYDLSGNGYNGALINTTSYSTSDGGTLVFNGTDDRVEISNNQLARIGTGNHTIMVWVNNDITTEEDIVSTGVGETGDILLMIYSEAGGGLGGLRGHVWGSTGDPNTIDSPRAIGTGNWSLLVQRVEWGANIDLFENGIKTATKPLVGSAPSSSRTNFIIGSRQITSDINHFDGKISNTMIYNRALTDAEVLQNFNATKDRFGL